jgi:hypothetical protein
VVNHTGLYRTDNLVPPSTNEFIVVKPRAEPTKRLQWNLSTARNVSPPPKREMPPEMQLLLSMDSPPRAAYAPRVDSGIGNVAGLVEVRVPENTFPNQ